MLNNTCFNINNGNSVPYSLNFLIHIPIYFPFNIVSMKSEEILGGEGSLRYYKHYLR